MVHRMDVSGIFQKFPDLFGKEHAAVLTAGTSHADDDVIPGAPLELFENVNQRNSLDDLASESTFRKLVEDGTR